MFERATCIYRFSFESLGVRTKRLLVDRCHFDGLYDRLFNRLFAKQMCQIALLPTSVRAVDGAIFANAEEQRIDDHLRIFDLDNEIQLTKSVEVSWRVAYLVQGEYDMGDQKSEHSNKQTRYHIEVDVLAMAEQ